MMLNALFQSLITAIDWFTFIFCFYAALCHSPTVCHEQSMSGRAGLDFDRRHVFGAVAADEVGAGLGPRIQAAPGAGEFGARLSPLRGLHVPRCRLPLQGELACLEFLEGAGEGSVRDDVVVHLVAGLLASDFPRVGRAKTDLFHFLGPLAVVIARPAWVAENMLPHVTHLMDEHRRDLLVGLP